MNLEDALGGWPSGGNNPQQPANPTWPGGQSGGEGAWPGQPGHPSQPTQPYWPGQPGHPSQPTQPYWPGQPGQPSQPTQPYWPGQPGQPSQPTQPSWPGQSGQPSQPSQPSWPSPGPNPGPGLGPGPGPGPGFGLPQKKNMTVPYILNLPDGVHDKLLITIVGTIKPNADKITVDMSTSKDLAFHFNPRFNEGGRKVIVRNSCSGKKWGKEERECSGHFPFAQGKPFEMKIMCTNGEFKVTVNNSHLLTFQHRIRDLRNINKVNIYNDLTLSDVHIERLP